MATPKSKPSAYFYGYALLYRVHIFLYGTSEICVTAAMAQKRERAKRAHPEYATMQYISHHIVYATLHYTMYTTPQCTMQHITPH